MKRFFYLLSVLICSFSLVSCAGDDNSQSTESTDSSKFISTDVSQHPTTETTSLTTVSTNTITNPIKSVTGSNQVKIAFFDAKNYDCDSFDKANKDFNYNFDFYAERLSSKNVSLTNGYDFVCVFVNDDVNREVIQALKNNNIKGILLRCTGYNNVDIAAAKELGVKVLYVPSYSPESIAEHTITLLLSLTRHLPEAYNRTTSMNFSLDGLTGRNLNGLTAGIIGAGRIGKIVAKLLKAFGMNVLLYNRTVDESWAKENGMKYVDLDTLLKESDVVSLHVSLSSDTYHILNADKLKLMKKDAVVINTGRGGLIDTNALINALKTGELGGAGLDVYENEAECFFKDCSNEGLKDETLKELLSLPNVILTGHQAFLTDIALDNIASITLENVDAMVNNKTLDNEVPN